jgi:PAT family beta-lactamase induction signal transducer AmpG
VSDEQHDGAEQENHDWRYYLQRPVIVIFFLGFSGGLPFPLVYATMTAWLADAEITRSTISTFAWLGFAYSFKFLWSPLVDSVSVPFLTRWLGHRRAWLFTAQLALGVGLFSLANVDPANEMTVFALIAVAVAFLSATQDIVIDAYRIESAEQELQSVLAAAYQYGYRLAVVLASAGALYMAQFGSWSMAYKVMAFCMAAGLITTLMCREPTARISTASKLSGGFSEQAGQWLFISIIEPFADFVRRYKRWAYVLLAFIASFYISDRVLGILANPFYLDIGFSKAQVATVAKLYGTWISLLGIGAGAAAVIKFGLPRCIVVASILIVSTNLFFAAMALTGPRIEMLTLTISFDNFAAGFGSTVMIVYMSGLVNIEFTATQYALLSSIGTFFGKFFAGYSGDVQLAIGWFNFFLYAAATGIPAIVLAFVVARRHNESMKEL